MTRIIAMHLPQYHRIPENDKWWGEGFTEWNNVRRAIPLFSGHIQPRIPYEYYDLSHISSMIAQMKMAREYGVDGFAFYHYWFNGKKLLEKPIEKLRAIEATPIDYCLCWANGTWNRRWDGFDDEVLLKQEYGGVEDWEEHYDYLSTFFKCRNYIKKDNKPVIIIYDKGIIPHVREMYDCWRNLAINDGFDGLHIIETHRKKLINEVPFYGDGVMRFEPFATLNELQSYAITKMSNAHQSLTSDRKYEVIDYETFCDHLTHRFYFRNENQYLGFFTGWDNSPRVGERVTLMFEHNDPKVFERYFRILYEKSVRSNSEYLFINAWNEWGEGTFLEPDYRNGFAYLEAISNVKREYSG